MFCDSHAHLDDEAYDDDRSEMLSRARKSGISLVINVGYDLPSSRNSVALAREHDFIYAAVGIHPHDADTATGDAFNELREMAKFPKVVAIGEIGLDYYRELTPGEVQQEAFRKQISLAKELNKPIIVHDRDAHGDVMAILKEEAPFVKGGILHCFSGSWEMAKECLKLGFYISIAGPVTFNNAGKLKEIAAQVPLERLLIETDSPYLTPQPHRGKRNESSYVVHVAERIAELREITPEEIGEVTTANAKKIFGID